MQIQAAKVSITTKEFSAKFRSKTEVYAFLSIDVEAYLPQSECVNIYFLKDLVTGKKKCKYHLRLILPSQISKQKISKFCSLQTTRDSASKPFSQKLRSIQRF